MFLKPSTKRYLPSTEQPTVTSGQHRPPELGIVERVTLLRRVSLFEGTPGKVLAVLAGLASETVIDAGAVLLREGEPGDTLFVVTEGRLEMTTNRPSASRRLTRAGVQLPPIGDPLADLRDDPRQVWNEPWLRACAVHAMSELRSQQTLPGQ
jgi:hypothetical protein